MSAPNLQKLISTYVAPLQELENVFFLLLDWLDLDAQSDAQLDLIGSLAGCGRQGDTDARYRVRIHAQRLVNKSKGTIPEMCAILEMLSDTSTFTIIPGNEAEFEIRVNEETTVTIGRQLSEAVERAKVFGVRSITVYRTTDTYFGFSGDSDPDATGFDGIGGFFFP